MRKRCEPVRITPADVIVLGEFKMSLVVEAAEDEGFSVQAAPIALHELQEQPELSSLSRLGAISSGEFDKLELLYQVGLTLARSH